MKRIIPVLVLLFLSIQAARAQHSDDRSRRDPAQVWLDSLKSISHHVINDNSEPERYNSSYRFIKTLVSALKMPRSFNMNFDSLKTISVQTSPDRSFRIFSWHVMNNDGSYRYYGTIQMNNPEGKLEMFPLVDYTPAIKNPGDTLTGNDKWFGAQYYRIIPVTYNVKQPYYVLLGWKGNTVRSTKKVIEILYFKEGKAHFGMPVFDGSPENAGKKRVIFEYARQASMVLNYDAQTSTIVFDHLAPPDQKLEGRYELYGPDFSYDGFKLINGRWRFMPDLKLKNPPTNKDEQFNDPRKMGSTEKPD